MAKTTTNQMIQMRRLEKGLSLREMARRANLTASFISQVENSKANVSLDSLRRISEVLGVSMLDLLPEQTPVDTGHAGENLPARAQSNPLVYSPVVRSGSRVNLTFPGHGIAYQLLTSDLNRKMEAIIGNLTPGSENVARRLREPTEEFIYVLSGELLVELDAGEYILEPGDSIYFEGLSLRRLECASKDEPVQWISVFTPAVF